MIKQHLVLKAPAQYGVFLYLPLAWCNNVISVTKCNLW